MGAMKRKPQPYELVKFVRSKVDPPIDTTEAYEYLKDFKPRRRLAGHDFLNTVVSNVHNSVRSDIVQEAAQRFYRAMKRKPQPYELVKFVRSKVDPPIDTTEAYEYLKDFKPRR